MKLEADPIITNELRRVRQLVTDLELMEQQDIQRQVETLLALGWVALEFFVHDRPYQLLCSPFADISCWDNRRLNFPHHLPQDLEEWIKSLPEDQYVWLF